jgi:transposase-like protein
VLGFAVGDSEDGAFWTAFLRSLKARGLAGTQLVISDAHTGLKTAIGSTNPLEGLNKEIKWRTDVVGVFPNPDALLRLK